MLNSALGDTIRWVLSHFVHLQGLGWVEAHRCLIDTMTATPPREETATSRSALAKYAIIAASSAAATFLVTLLHGKMSRRRAHRTHVCSDGAAPKTARVKPNPALGGLIVIVGVGGVGSHAAHMLTRAGATNLRLVDFDLITLSSLNRHCSAVHTDVGRQKTAVLAEYIKSYADVSCSIEEIPFTFDKDSANSILRDGEGRNKIAYVLDCIDNTETKAELLQQCLQRGLRVVSSMGAGSRADPTRIHVSNISEVKGDELGRAVRMQLAATSKMDLTQVDIPCVWSSESARKGLVKLSEEQRQKPEDFGNREGFRLGIVPVLGTIPALFGASMASRCISDLCGHPIPFLRLPPMTDHLVTKMTQTLGRTERQITGDKKVRLAWCTHGCTSFLTADCMLSSCFAFWRS